MRDDDSNVLASISGKPVNAFGHFLSESSWGKTRLELHETRLIEDTKHIVSEQHSEILLQEMQGAAFVTRPNPLLIGIGFATIALFGLGLILLLLALFVGKKRFLIFHGGTFTQHLSITGDANRYLNFMEDVLTQAEKIKRERKVTGGSSSSGNSNPVSTGTSSRARDEIVMNCPACDTEYKLPAGSAGKKFRCSSCKAVMQAPEN